MKREQEAPKEVRPKFLENSLLMLAALFAHLPLYYQVPRLAKGVDATYVHPYLLAHSRFPFILHMAAIPPLIWIILLIVIFIRLCKNYGWRLEK